MKKYIGIALAVLMVLGLSGMAMAVTDTDTQLVSITFSEIAVLAADGDPVLMTIAAPAAGDLPDDETDASTTMAWTSNVENGSTRKITGSLDVFFPGINLYAEVAAAGTAATSEGKTEFAIAGTDYNFVIGITNENTSGETITYTAEVTAMVAPYINTQQTVTWTLTEDAP